MPDFTLTAFSCFVDALRLAADDADLSRQIDCSWAVVGEAATPVRSSCGVAVAPSCAFANAGTLDYVAVIGGLLPSGRRINSATARFLRAMRQLGVPLLGVCTGSFVLARLGLLEDVEACVSWFHRAAFASEFPERIIRTDRSFVLHDKGGTCAGGLAAAQFAAQLVATHCSRTQASKALRIMIATPSYPVNPPQPTAGIALQPLDDLVRRACHVLERRIDESMLVKQVAAELGVGARQLERRFQRDLGMSPSQYRIRLRLAHARWMIEETNTRVRSIALECGFQSLPDFSKRFKREFCLSPTDHRAASRDRLRELLR